MPADSFDPLTWHAHEMIFGFVGAMIAGFLLTAVPNWTGEKGKQGAPLVVLALLWIAARVLLLCNHTSVGGLVDLAFIPGLAALLVPSLIRKKERKTLVFVPILGIFWLANLLMHLQAWDLAWTARSGISIGVALILLLITIIGGRIIPFFTSSALKTEPKRWVPVEVASVLSILVMPFIDILAPARPVIVAWAVVACLAHGARLWAWTSRRVWTIPLLWVLHLGYAWLVVGLALRGLAALNLVPISSALHAFTAGAMGVLGLGIMSRASLGYTGRPLQTVHMTNCSFVLVNLAALLRITGPLLGLHPHISYGFSGALWCLAYIFFLWIYAPILFRARADGKPG